MAFTADQITALEEAIASGALKVKYQDREVTYQTTDDMLKALAMMKASVATAANNRDNGRRYGAYSKGFK